jgi:hypothetical protein
MGVEKQNALGGTFEAFSLVMRTFHNHLKMIINSLIEAKCLER